MTYELSGYFAQLVGTSREVGRIQGELIKHNPILRQVFVLPEPLPPQVLQESMELLDEYCPGANEELLGAAEAIGVEPAYMAYYAATDIGAGCSHGAVLPAKSADGGTYVLRNYDLSPKIEDMRLCSTSVTGMYSHTGFSTFMFGRTEGMNEHGLCITFSACGQPVGALEGLRKPGVRGLQFWAVIRTLLERCRDTSEAIAAIQDMPIAANMNMIVADASGRAALVGVFDGEIVIREAGESTEQAFITATNHPLFPEIEQRETTKLQQSIVRQRLLDGLLQSREQITKEDLLTLVEEEYPRGLTVHNYDQWFGTLHSLLFDLQERSLKVCFGSPILNPWYTVRVGESLPFTTVQVKFLQGQYGPDFWERA